MEHAWPLVTVVFSLYHQNKRSTLEVQLKENCLQLTRPRCLLFDWGMSFLNLKRNDSNRHWFLSLWDLIRLLNKAILASVIQLERNGWKSSDRRSKLIDMQYFWIKDKLKSSKVDWVLYKSTGVEIQSIILTKALLQGNELFIVHQSNLLMGLDAGTRGYTFYEKYKKAKQMFFVSVKRLATWR